MMYAISVLRSKISDLENAKGFLKQDSDDDLMKQTERKIDEINAAIQILNARGN